MSDLLARSMVELARLMGEGEIKARALAEEAIANHDRLGKKLMAYSQWAPDHARQCADAADAAFAIGSRAGSLQGIPASIKDLFAHSGFPDLCRLAQAVAGEVRARRAGDREPAPTTGHRHRQDAYGRIRFRRHRPQRALRRAAQSLGCERASLARRLVERRRGEPLRRLGAARFRQRHRGIGAAAGVVHRQCGFEIHQGPLVDRRHRHAQPHFRYARHPGAAHGRRGVQLCRARSATRRRLRFPQPRAARHRRHPHRHCRFLLLGWLRERHRRGGEARDRSTRPRRRHRQGSRVARSARSLRRVLRRRRLGGRAARFPGSRAGRLDRDDRSGECAAGQSRRRGSGARLSVAALAFEEPRRKRRGRGSRMSMSSLVRRCRSRRR